MSTVDVAARAVENARDALDRFARTYGELPLRLLLHAAVPQSFRGDTLNLLKINFVPEAGADFSVDADVLLSPAVEAVGGGYFRLDPELRRQCLDLLDVVYRSPGSRRSVRVAHFLLAYVDHVERQTVGGPDPLLSEYLATQRWVALAFIDPAAVARALAENVRDQIAGDRTAVHARLGSVAAALTIPLGGHRALLDYARGIDALLSGDKEAAKRLLTPLGDEELRVGDIVLRPASELIGERERISAATGEERKAPPRIADFSVFRDVDAPWCPEMVVIPAGEFLMGSPEKEEGRFDDEEPQHKVTIGTPFAIGRYPVTVGEYRKFVEATGHRHEGGLRVWTGSEWKEDASKSWQDPGFAQTDRNPVVGVNWRDAVAYCEWLAKETGKPYRLPSEAEWEYAARAGTTTRYSWGDAITEKNANFERKVGKTSEVGAYPPNPWGLYDMHGNVWEWVEDVWHENYKGAPVDGSAWTDKEGKDSSRDRVNRGGSWGSYPRYLRSANRFWNVPGSRGGTLGFRLARTLS
ncbi:MAG: formylglycine-generating enzyme family protein [Defluviicoccus sp.]